MTDSAAFSDAPGVIVVANDAGGAADAIGIVTQAGGRWLATVAWDAALARIADQAAPTTLMIETFGVAEPDIAAILPALVAAVGAERAIVSFDTSLIDAVAVALIGTEATLLCDASPADRIAALAVATTTRDLTLLDSSGEAARLARIHQEVARFTETLARLTGASAGPATVPGAPPMVGDRLMEFGQPSGSSSVTPGDIRKAIRARRLRDEAFGLAGLFEDPAWDMMLDLFAADLERRQVSVSSLCIAAAVAPTTALRWINKLIEVGLFERRPDELDRRRAFVALTPRAAAAMRDYVSALDRAGLTLA